MGPDLVISVCGSKDLENWSLFAPHVVDRLEAHEYIVIVPDEFKREFEVVAPKSFQVHPESLYADRWIEELRDKMGSGNSRFDWYVQQFLKLEALERNTDCDRLLIWDADTVPLKPLTFFSEQGCHYFTSKEYHLPYFQAIDHILGMDRIVPYSFIAQNFPILGSQAREFFDLIENSHSQPWFSAIMNGFDPKESSGFSEYETLGTFISHQFADSLVLQTEAWTRDGWKMVRKSQTSMKDVLGSGQSDHSFASFEQWQKPETWGRTFTSARLSELARALLIRAFQKGKRLLGKIKSKLQSSRNPLDAHLAEIIQKTERLQIIQIGANDGVQNDPLRKYLRQPGKYRATLIEPIPYYASLLRNLYGERTDVRILTSAAGPVTGRMTIYHIDPEVATLMNGDGPPNNWALGQGSFSRATVVYWIHQNAFRGDEYRKNIPHWIDSIQEESVPITQTKELISEFDGDTLLVIDVQGYELEVLKGLDLGNLPRWILMEEDLGTRGASQFLSTLGGGYQEKYRSQDALFELLPKNELGQ